MVLPISSVLGNKWNVKLQYVFLLTLKEGGFIQ